MKNVIIYHNPRCSKSRQALQLLLDNRIEPTVIEYLKKPLSAEEINQLLKLLSLSPKDLLRKNEPVLKEILRYAQNDSALPQSGNVLSQNDITMLKDEEIVEAMVKNPILIERPVVIVNQKAIIARPPEKVLELIE